MNTHPSRTFSRRSLLEASGAIAISTIFHGTSTATLRAASGRDSEEPTGTAKFLELMGHVDRRMTDLGVPAVAVAVVDGDTRHTCALGVTSVDDPELADARTMFRLGPLSRLFTGSAIGSLIESGAMALDDPVRSYIPTLAVRDSNAPVSLTVGDLVTHRTGWQGDLAFDPGNGVDALARYVDEMKTLPFLARPGELFSYGQADGVLAGYLLEEITGLPFEEAIRDLTLSPLSMDQSSFLVSDILDLQVAQGHTRSGSSVATVDPLRSSRVAAPVTGIFSNLNEILHFASFHAFASTPPTFITAPVREMMHRPLASGGSVGPLRADAMGVCWMVSDVDGRSVSMHAGVDHGQSAMIVAVPSEKFAVVVLANADFAQDLAIEIAYYALDLFPGVHVPSPLPLDRPDAELRKMEGTYGGPDAAHIKVVHDGSGLRLESNPGDDTAEAVSGPLTFISPLTAMLKTADSTLYVDFVLDHGGDVGWIRHMGQLAARVSA